MNYIFLGKWTFDQDSKFVQTDKAGKLVVQPAPAYGRDRFNIYGSATAFVIQSASNGKYVVRSGTSYEASQIDRKKASFFKIETTTGPSFHVVDLGVDELGPQALWGTSNGQVVAVGVSDPPPTTVFTKTVVTQGIADIEQNGFQGPNADMNWVNISGTDLSGMFPSNFDLSGGMAEYADFSNCIFPQNINFNGAKCQRINLSKTTLQSANCGNVDFTNAVCDHANMGFISLTQSICDGMSAVGTNMSSIGSLSGSTTVSNCTFKKAMLNQWSVVNSFTISSCDFSDASLKGADFTGASVGLGNNDINLSGADLTGAKLHNKKTYTKVYPKSLIINSKTNLTDANISYLDLTDHNLNEVVFSGANLTGCKLDNTTLNLADLSYATLDGSTLTGTVTLHGANLSNASLRGCDLTGAQLGAVSNLFSIPNTSQDYNKMLTALRSSDAVTVTTIFSANGFQLTGDVTITTSSFSQNSWTVSTSASSVIYAVNVVTVGATSTIEVGTKTTPAVLSNAFLVNTKFNNANLVGVDASGAALYSINSGSNGMNAAQMRDMTLTNANLSNQSFASVALAGVNFDFATLSNADFSNATITTSSTGLRTTFNGANLLGCKFDGAMINDAVFTNSAFGIGNPKDSNPKTTAAGAWLFTIAAAAAESVVAELNAAQTPPNQFVMPASHLSAFDTPGKPVQGIVKTFAQHGITLTDEALLTISGRTPFWQLNDGNTHYVIMQSVNFTNYQPGLGVANGSDYSISPEIFLPLSLQDTLVPGKVSQKLQAALKKSGISVSDTATLNVAQQPSDWQIINGEPNYEVYTLWLDLLENGPVIQVRPSLSTLIESFADFSTAISTRAIIYKLKDSSTRDQIGWIIDNNSKDPFNAVTNYVLFRLLKNNSGALDVYGGVLRVKRLSSEGNYEYSNIAAGITKITESQLSGGGNISPNGEFSSTNHTNNLPFNMWLRPRVPPRPPLCVPDPAGSFICSV